MLDRFGNKIVSPSDQLMIPMNHVVSKSKDEAIRTMAELHGVDANWLSDSLKRFEFGNHIVVDEQPDKIIGDENAGKNET